MRGMTAKFFLTSLLVNIIVVTLISTEADAAPESKPSPGSSLKRDKKQIYLPVENTEEHHGHPHHHHPDAHFPGNNAHHHHGTGQTDHTVESHTHTISEPKVLVKTEHVDTSQQRTVKTEAVPGGVRTVVHTSLNPVPSIHSHHETGSSAYYHTHPAPHKAPPGFPSSDYVKYYAKYTSNGGSPQEAAHSYYRDHNGHLYNYDVEPRFADPAYVRSLHTQGTVPPYVPDPVADALHDADLPSSSSGTSSSGSSSRSSAYHAFHPDPYASQRNTVQAGNQFHSRINTGRVDSPSGKGPHHGFYFGDQENAGRIIVGDRVLRF